MGSSSPRRASFRLAATVADFPSVRKEKVRRTQLKAVDPIKTGLKSSDFNLYVDVEISVFYRLGVAAVAGTVPKGARMMVKPLKLKLSIPKLRCMRCGYRWTPRQSVIRMCPDCKSTNWQTKRTDRRGLRPEGGK